MLWSYLCKEHVNASLQPSFRVDVQAQCLLSQSLEFLWTQLVQNIPKLVKDLFISLSVFIRHGSLGERRHHVIVCDCAAPHG